MCHGEGTKASAGEWAAQHCGLDEPHDEPDGHDDEPNGDGCGDGCWDGRRVLAALMEREEEEVVESPPVKAPAPEPPAAAEPPRAGGVAVTVAGDSFAEAYASLQSCRSSLNRSEMKIPRCVGYLRLLPKARSIVIHDRDLSLDAQND